MSSSKAPSVELRNVEGGVKEDRRPVRRTGTALLYMSFQTLGIIYSDIGTSPLYVLNGIWPATGPVPSEEDVIGGISAIIWALTLVPLLKYVFFCLRFGTSEGEGGTFALYNGIFPPPAVDDDEDRTLTGDSSKGLGFKTQSRSRSILKWTILPWTLFGTALTMSDGVLTPAVSVTSAVGGIAIAKPSVAGSVIPISIAFLVVLFLAQRFGTHRLAVAFAPVTFIWFILLAITGIINVTKYPGVFRAFDPSRAVMLFVRTKQYDLLAGILLAITGCEALFANLGQFNALSIQITFASMVYPALILAYLGQGARLIVDGERVLANVFYQTIPGPTGGPLYWILYIFAILATLIASQAMITATFSLIQQLINLKSFPPLKMVYTSNTIQGQVYVPAANYVLMIACIAMVAAFKNLVNLTNAYGFAVATVMIVTTSLVSLQIVVVKHRPVALAILFLLFFGFLDGLFWGASLRKVPTGAWVPLMLGAILTALMLFWTWAKGLEDDFDGKNRRNLSHFLQQATSERPPTPAAEGDVSEEYDGPEGDEKLALYFVDGRGSDKRELARLPTCAVFHKLSAGRGVPHAFYAFVRQWPALPRVAIFLSVRVLPIARVAPEDRYIVNKVRSLEGFYGVTYCLGFRDDFEPVTLQVIDQICAVEAAANRANAAQNMARIREAARNSTNIIPHYHVTSKKISVGFLTPVVQWIRIVLIESIYLRLATMFPETANWAGAHLADEIIRVGVAAQI